jgi:hypothetical protein
MKTIHEVAAQGDVFFVRVNEIPDSVKPVPPKNGFHVVAHSETGHHHQIAADGRVELLADAEDPFTCYLRVDGFAEVVHARPFDTHEPFRLGGGLWMVRRQREYTPEGFRRVED